MPEDEWHNGNSYQALMELFGLVRINDNHFESAVCTILSFTKMLSAISNFRMGQLLNGRVNSKVEEEYGQMLTRLNG